MAGAAARLRAFWATTQGKVAIVGSGAGVAGLLGLRARAKKATAGGSAPAVATSTPSGDPSYAGGQATGPLGPPGFGSNFLPTPRTVGAGTGLTPDLWGTDWSGPNLAYPFPEVVANPNPPAAPSISAPPAASAPVAPVAIINTPPPAYTARPAPVTGSPIASVTQRFTSPYQVAAPTSAYYTAVTPPAPSAPAPVAPNPVRVIPPPTAAPVYRSLTTPTSNVTKPQPPAPQKAPTSAAKPGPGPPLKGPR